MNKTCLSIVLKFTHTGFLELQQHITISIRSGMTLILNSIYKY